MIFSIVLKAANIDIVPSKLCFPKLPPELPKINLFNLCTVPSGLFVASSLYAMLVTVHYVKA
jgi:hypothetical protein